ncbi:MAG TPA: amino acid adenylation domain-containing protein, partial [Bacillota bacterium]|nr:amino acid adenylation domain-containing protein [Bacillota bacterium]
PVTLLELPIQYADYAVWQRDWLQGPVLEQHLAFWRAQLGGNPPITELPTDRPRRPAPSFRGGNQARALSRELSKALQQLANAQQSTLFMVLLAAFKALLYRYTQQEDIIIGSPIAGRNRVETEGLVGFFVNTLPLRTRLEGNLTFEQLLARVREGTLGAYAHQDLPFEKLVEELQPERSLDHMPFAKLMFVVQNSLLEEMQWDGVKVQFLEVESDTAKFDATLVWQETSRGLVARVEYNSDLFEPATIGRLLQHLEMLLKGIVANPKQRLAELPLLTEAERQQLLVEWNRTTTDYPRNWCTHQIFETQVERAPQAIALSFGPQSMSYAELNARANQLAHYLKQFHIGPDVPVGICVDRSMEMVVGVLAILKAGGAYVPLDASYPRERLEFMLQDTAAPVLLTQQSLLSRMPHHLAKVICLDADWELVARESRHNLATATQPDSLAYVMYTSGSTGQPKGVAVPHRAVNRLVLNTDYIHLDATDRIAQVSNFSFDAATFEIWGALLNGGQLVGITKDVALSPRDFARELREQGITAIFLTSALFNQLASEVPGAFESLRTAMAGGEALDPKWVRHVLGHRPPQRLVNGYGPTENTTFTCCYHIRDLTEAASNVPIGRPIANTQVYILDRHLNPVPIGMPGELYAGGDGVARGYWKRPELTAEKFIPNPFCHSQPAAYLYKTGDLARYLPDGNIEFLGRIDQQVKVRGFRIELGEIETVLGQHPGVRECVVTVYGKGVRDRRLAAYFVPGSEPAPKPGELRAFVSEKLPDYMVPAVFVPLTALPLTPNGKVDRKALPAPDQARPDLERKYACPRDAVERQLTRIWENVL